MRTVVAGGLAALVAMAGAGGCQAPPKIGDIAPDFVAKADTGQAFRLSDLRSKSSVVLYFYPGDETPGCTTEACELRDRVKEFQEKGAEIVGVSCNTVESHQAFKGKYELPFTLIADPEGKVARLYGVPLTTPPAGGTQRYVAKRETFLINKEGTVVGHFAVQDPRQHVKWAADWDPGL
jgi:peroxiredoxin Q/BCP